MFLDDVVCVFQEPMLDNLDVSNLKLECAVHFGSVKMATRCSTVQPQDKGVTTKHNRQQDIQGEEASWSWAYFSS